MATYTNSQTFDPPILSTWSKSSSPDRGELWLSAKAVCGKRKAQLLRLREKSEDSEENGFPKKTEPGHLYALQDKFHQGNTKDSHDVLQRVDLAPEFQDCVNSKEVKHLFADKMRKNSYSLESMAPNTHMFMMRNLIESI